jgi:hypothetical protein
MVDDHMKPMLPKVIGGKLFYGLKAFKTIKGPWTQETSKHLKKGGVKGNKGSYEGGSIIKSSMWT